MTTARSASEDSGEASRPKQRLPRTGFAVTAGTVREIAALAARGEELGYESVWIAEVAGYDAVTLLTAIAAETRTLRIGTGIAGIYLRDPLLMAMSANAVNEYSQGRLLLGLGTSTPVIVERWHGMPWGKPLGHMREYTSLVRRLLAGERVKSSGLYNFSGAQLAVPAGGTVPIYFGALNPSMLALAGEVADGVILNFPTLSYTRRAVEAVNQAVPRAGRPAGSVNITAFLRTTATNTIDAMLPRCRRELLTYILAPVYRRVFSEDGYGDVCDEVNALWQRGEREAALAAVSVRFIHDHMILGTDAECIERMQEFRAAGVDNAIVFPFPESDEDAVASIGRTVTALAPATTGIAP